MARVLRSGPDLVEADLVEVAQWWLDAARPYGPKDPEEVVEFVLEAYSSAEVPIDSEAGFLAELERRSITMKAAQWVEARRVTQRALIKVCYVAQAMQHGDGPFYLSCRDAGRLCGVSSVRASVAFDVLCREKIIERVGERKGREAARYRYIGPSAAA